MLPNLIFLFNLLDVIPPDVQLYGKAGGKRHIFCLWHLWNMSQLYRIDIRIWCHSDLLSQPRCISYGKLILHTVIHYQLLSTWIEERMTGRQGQLFLQSSVIHKICRIICKNQLCMRLLLKLCILNCWSLEKDPYLVLLFFSGELEDMSLGQLEALHCSLGAL